METAIEKVAEELSETTGESSETILLGLHAASFLYLQHNVVPFTNLTLNGPLLALVVSEVQKSALLPAWLQLNKTSIKFWLTERVRAVCSEYCRRVQLAGKMRVKDEAKFTPAREFLQPLEQPKTNWFPYPVNLIVDSVSGAFIFAASVVYLCAKLSK